MIIPFFIPHAGCPHQCVFCNQKNITGQNRSVLPSQIPHTVQQYIGSRRRTTGKGIQIAFYGGTFTALPIDLQRQYLESAVPFIRSGQIESIRISTRPDCISNEILSFLTEYRVGIIELGAQSMNNEVLARSGRGHTAEDTVNAVRLLKSRGFMTGIQLMPGLPDDSRDVINETVSRVIDLKPDFVRLYPTLVIRGTQLERWHQDGAYMPLSLEEAVSVCGEALARLEQSGIKVIRIGLQPTEELEAAGTILAGPYHPAFRQLVESSMYRERIRAALKERPPQNESVLVYVHPADVSYAVGQKRSNIRALEREFGFAEVRVVPDRDVNRGMIRVRSR